ncbi:MAG TPA: copper chaperone PCu(A)C [Acidisoma sp.]|uniref:copper chaperone PCu(A)C n=1 Tax=Acidisoma sp. TaxID=1872115 RepID=UPI002C0268E5|nr:copper chaperone PCu(A)C [Acidisoma sp.]HTI03119.1 copper chaperone PCu(A)C [Acidisoma sp.]
MRQRACAAIIALWFLAPSAWAGAPIVVVGAWARVTAAPSMPAVVYLTVRDHGAADQLVAVSSPVARQASLHVSRMANNVMVMQPVASLPVAPGRPLRLAPGGYHIMLEGLAHSLVAGSQFPLTLTFAKAGAVTVTVTVEPMSFVPPGEAAEEDDDDDDDMAGMKM